MVERPLSMREASGSIPESSRLFCFHYHFVLYYSNTSFQRRSVINIDNGIKPQNYQRRRHSAYATKLGTVFESVDEQERLTSKLEPLFNRTL